MQPTSLQPGTPTEILIEWNDGLKYSVPYIEIRFYCPCASCIDEHTGERVIERSSIDPAIRVTGVHPIGRYALQLNWSDGHSTGIYHYDRIRELCEKQGKILAS